MRGELERKCKHCGHVHAMRPGVAVEVREVERSDATVIARFDGIEHDGGWYSFRMWGGGGSGARTP